MENKLREIELVTTVEITHIYSEDDIAKLDGFIPETPEDLAEFKKNVADETKRAIEASLDADYVLVTNVQYFEKDNPKSDEDETTEEA